MSIPGKTHWCSLGSRGQQDTGLFMCSRDRTFPAVPAKQQGLEAGLVLPSLPRTQNMGRGPRPSGLPVGTFPVPTLLLPHCCFNMVGGGLPAHSPHPSSLHSPQPVVKGGCTRPCHSHSSVVEGGGRSLASALTSSELTSSWASRCARACRGEALPHRWLPGRRALVLGSPRPPHHAAGGPPGVLTGLAPAQNQRPVPTLAGGSGACCSAKGGFCPVSACPGEKEKG